MKVDAVGISFLVYTLVIMAFGIYAAKYARRSSSDFFLAGRGLGAWVAALSSSASAESGWVTLGLVGIAFNTGVGALWILPGTVAGFLFNWLVVGRRLRGESRRRGAITIPDMLASPFPDVKGLLIRISSILIIVVMLTFYVAAQMTAAAKTFEATFGWSYAVGVAVGAAIVLIYTTMGGFRAVAWTDVVQASLMVMSVIVLPIVLVVEMGGVGAVWETLEVLQGDQHTLTHVFGGKTGLAMIGFLSVWFGIPFGYPGQPHVLVRFMATRDERAIRRGAIVSTIWVFFLFSGAVLLGMAARAYYGALPDPEKALPTAAGELMPGVIAGLMIAAVMAAICSTADSQLLVTASAVSHDLFVKILRLVKTEEGKVLVNRITVLVIGLAAAGVAMTETRVIWTFVLYAWDGLAAAFGPGLILLLLWRRTTGWGVFAGVLAGFTTAVIWRTVEFWPEAEKLKTLHNYFYALIPAFLLALLTVFVVSLVTKPDRAEPEASAESGG